MDTETTSNGEEVVEVSAELIELQIVEEKIDKLNENLVQGFGLIAALIGLVIGFECAKELFRSWLH